MFAGQFVFAAGTETWIDDFSVPGPVADRYHPAWQDVRASSGRYFSPDEGWRRMDSFLKRRFKGGTIKVDTGFVRPLKLKDVGDFYCSGLVVKTVRDEVVRLRFGAYGAIILEGFVAGEKFESAAKPFPVEPGRRYQLSVTLRDSRLKVEVDDKVYYDLDCPISSEPGHTGFYCESPVWYDNYRVTDVLPDAMAITGTPRLEVIHAGYRADFPEPYETVSVHGAIELYLRNNGDGPAQLESLELNGQPVEWQRQSSPVSFYDQRPWWIEPREIGLVLMRIRGLPEKMGDAVVADHNARLKFAITAHWSGDVTQSFSVPFRGKIEPFQINALGFSKNLKRLYIYVQNNAWMYRGDETPVALSRVLVGGQDVTAFATFGQHRLAGDIIPIVVDLQNPLPERRTCWFRRWAVGGTLPAGHPIPHPVAGVCGRRMDRQKGPGRKPPCRLDGGHPQSLREHGVGGR